MKKNDPTKYAETPFGFDWGLMRVERCISHHGYAVINIRTPRGSVHIETTPTGKLSANVTNGKRAYKWDGESG